MVTCVVLGQENDGQSEGYSEYPAEHIVEPLLYQGLEQNVGRYDQSHDDQGYREIVPFVELFAYIRILIFDANDGYPYEGEYQAEGDDHKGKEYPVVGDRSECFHHGQTYDHGSDYLCGG